ncbi:hypothetical protein CGZ93_07990 [Enemella dayhoffiae]|uniref:ERCC4 domain-containing protein n=1 Tax=Enemella dayhoffiae TaxID=2016507 RepID=A0A255H2U4_9ACTN|nr:ERCC4 domain-containing protein [Enemella dayhoffiae]OYO21877.1 hypothetical protein CGZ93_07990 [Enemella dayhoffiae]
MPADFLIAHNPEEGTSLPYLVRIPLGERGIVLKVRELWPRTSKVYCHRAEWPEDADIIQQVPTRSCSKRGAAIDLVLDRGRENRSQFVLTMARGREMIFWQTARVAKQARPKVRTPTAKASGIAELEILVDVHERYAWKFTHQQAGTRKQALPAGDYAVQLDDRVIASVERKSLVDLVTTITRGRMSYLLADLANLPRAAVVVEDRYSQVFALQHVRPAVVADQLGECQARFPSVPIIFAETRQLAQEWTYRFLAAAVHELGLDSPTDDRLNELAGAEPAPQLPPKPAVVRAWALENGHQVSARGRLAPELVEAYLQAHR